MKKNNSLLLSTPYVLWMLLFTLIPLYFAAKEHKKRVG